MRDFSKRRRYIFAFIITIAIFFLGFFFGFVMDIQRIDFFKNANDVNQLNIRSLQLQNDLLQNAAHGNQCEIFRYMFDKNIVELDNNRERLEIYALQSNVKQSDFDIIKRQYVLSQINFWLISKNLKLHCPNSSDYVPIIYFYSDSNICTECNNQGSVLDYYKSMLKQNILIFAIDERLDSQESLVSLLKTTYNVTSYPTVIIDDVPYTQFMGKDDMKKVLCDIYKTQETRSVICD